MPTLLFDLEEHVGLFEKLQARALREHISWDTLAYSLLEKALEGESVSAQVRAAVRHGPGVSRTTLLRRDKALQLLAAAGEKGITSFDLRLRLGVSSAAVSNLLHHLRARNLLAGEVGPPVTERPGRPPMYYRLREGNEAWLKVLALYERRAAQVLLLLARKGRQSTQQVADAHSWSHATANSVLKRLLSEGSVHQVNIPRDTPGRPEVGFQLPPEPPSEPA